MNAQLRELRINKGLTVTEAARRAGITRSAMSYIELGQRKPSPPVAFRIAAEYGLKVTDLWPLESDGSKAAA
jgi:putative molybdopterin biosynthesis protein